jgi:pSer/pThr/pTyr-binding forkhead associated (FHA) protein
MVRLRVIAGQRAGEVLAVAQFPAHIGRSSRSDLTFTDPGIWEQHLQLVVDCDAGFTLRVCAPAVASLNGQPVTEAPLRNGDIIDAGALRLQFWLAEPARRSFRAREAITWAALGLLCITQAALVYWMSR